MTAGPVTALEVTTDTGRVRGAFRDGLRHWHGIPYAAPPIGELRFRAPAPPTRWVGTRDCVGFGPPAAQAQRRRVVGSEDCLTVNVTAPGTSGSGRPVMVFVHGGAYSGGTASGPRYCGSELVARGEIVHVSLNYRLGVFGYLDFSQFDTPERTFEPNNGVRDQLAALEWVQRNIAAFGGDPDNVTLYGESSGANAVTTLMATPRAAGLFARAIAQSPPAASAYGRERGGQWARRVVAASGTPEPQRWLTSAAPEELIRVGEALATDGVQTEPGTRMFAPVVGDDLLPEHPLDVFDSGRTHPVPLIVGSTAHEGRVFPRFLDILPTDAERIEKMFSHTPAEVKARAIAAYPGYPHRRAAADLGGDVTFWEPSILCSQGHCEVAPTYAYRYDFAPRLLHLLGLGATHATDLYAVFGVHGPMRRALTALGGAAGLRAATDTVQSHWLHFAHHGAPGPDWPRYDVENRRTLIIDDATRVVADPDSDKRQAWIGYRHRR
ncbi:para-nitrobenzyl esterase [Rhodococcus triatomae]|uniref:Carboxylic ester hydrolase n=1 Tax=Rhodococcus triatomae TaxID=300028 RepID=A0A1G8AGH9_9NOCA|nr:para-nitrobenzyl esterase [Rhodococcus triatomae]